MPIPPTLGASSPARITLVKQLHAPVGNQYRVKLFQGYFFAILLLLTAAADGQSLAVQSAQSGNAATSYQPITGAGRLRWFTKSTIGPEGLAAGMFSAGFGTALNRPREYGPHWEGFSKRYGMRLTGVATGNAMEAGLGALWGKTRDTFALPGNPSKSG